MSASKTSLYAVCAPGLETVLADELRSLGFDQVKAERGGVAFAGGPTDALKANQSSRIASRILLVVARARTRSFDELIRLTRSVEWPRFLPPGPVKIIVDCKKSRLYHEGAVRERVQAALGPQYAAVDDPISRLQVRIASDRCTLSLDTSGELLHRRGYRLETGHAPIRETLAAGILALLGWDGTTPLFDPACGSGTFPIEAALIAEGRLPGANRTFASPAPAERVPPILMAGASGVEIVGSDRDERAVAAARRNIERAGVSVVIERTEMDDVEGFDGPPGLVVSNLPYGRRIRGGSGALDAFERLADRLTGWAAACLVPVEAPLGAGWEDLARLQNGGIRVRLQRRVRIGGAQA